MQGVIPGRCCYEKLYFEPESDGFHGVYYENPNKSNKAFIAMLGDDCDDMMAHGGVKYLSKSGCNVMCMSPAKKDYGAHNGSMIR